MRKFISVAFILILIFIGNFSYGADRLVDIPVPENSSGYADSNLKEKNNEIKEFDKKQSKESFSKKMSPKYAVIFGGIVVLIVGVIRFVVIKVKKH